MFSIDSIFVIACAFLFLFYVTFALFLIFVQHSALLSHVSSFFHAYSLCCIMLLASRFHTTSITSSLAICAETATAQFSILNVIPISFFFTSPRSKTQKIVSCSLIILLLLCGDILINPGPCGNTFQEWTLNIRFLLNPLK